jgi:hypothetical protein
MALVYLLLSALLLALRFFWTEDPSFDRLRVSDGSCMLPAAVLRLLSNAVLST